MEWKALERITHHHYDLIPESEVEELSSQLLRMIHNDSTEPLEAAKIAYTLVLVQLKREKPNLEKAKKFFTMLTKILKHEIQETELHPHENAEGHLLYVRKLAEHYFHHMMVVSELRECHGLTRSIHRLRRQNHEKLIKLQRSHETFWNREQQIIRSTLQSHYVFFGALFAMALFFSWNSFWSISDFAMAQWVFSEVSAEQVGALVQQAMMLVFSLGFLWFFSSYQKQDLKDPLPREEA